MFSNAGVVNGYYVCSNSKPAYDVEEDLYYPAAANRTGAVGSDRVGGGSLNFRPSDFTPDHYARGSGVDLLYQARNRNYGHATSESENWEQAAYLPRAPWPSSVTATRPPSISAGGGGAPSYSTASRSMRLPAPTEQGCPSDFGRDNSRKNCDRGFLQRPSSAPSNRLATARPTANGNAFAGFLPVATRPTLYSNFSDGARPIQSQSQQQRRAPANQPAARQPLDQMAGTSSRPFLPPPPQAARARSSQVAPDRYAPATYNSSNSNAYQRSNTGAIMLLPDEANDVAANTSTKYNSAPQQSVTTSALHTQPTADPAAAGSTGHTSNTIMEGWEGPEDAGIEPNDVATAQGKPYHGSAVLEDEERVKEQEEGENDSNLEGPRAPWWTVDVTLTFLTGYYASPEEEAEAMLAAATTRSPADMRVLRSVQCRAPILPADASLEEAWELTQSFLRCVALSAVDGTAMAKFRCTPQVYYYFDKDFHQYVQLSADTLSLASTLMRVVLVALNTDASDYSGALLDSVVTETRAGVTGEPPLPLPPSVRQESPLRPAPHSVRVSTFPFTQQQQWRTLNDGYRPSSREPCGTPRRRRLPFDDDSEENPQLPTPHSRQQDFPQQQQQQRPTQVADRAPYNNSVLRNRRTPHDYNLYNTERAEYGHAEYDAYDVQLQEEVFDHEYQYQQLQQRQNSTEAWDAAQSLQEEEQVNDYSVEAAAAAVVDQQLCASYPVSGRLQRFRFVPAAPLSRRSSAPHRNGVLPRATGQRPPTAPTAQLASCGGSQESSLCALRPSPPSVLSSSQPVYPYSPTRQAQSFQPKQRAPQYFDDPILQRSTTSSVQLAPPSVSLLHTTGLTESFVSRCASQMSVLTPMPPRSPPPPHLAYRPTAHPYFDESLSALSPSHAMNSIITFASASQLQRHAGASLTTTSDSRDALGALLRRSAETIRSKSENMTPQSEQNPQVYQVGKTVETPTDTATTGAALGGEEVEEEGRHKVSPPPPMPEADGNVRVEEKAYSAVGEVERLALLTEDTAAMETAVAMDLTTAQSEVRLIAKTAIVAAAAPSPPSVPSHVPQSHQHHDQQVVHDERECSAPVAAQSPIVRLQTSPGASLLAPFVHATYDAPEATTFPSMEIEKDEDMATEVYPSTQPPAAAVATTEEEEEYAPENQEVESGADIKDTTSYTAEITAVEELSSAVKFITNNAAAARSASQVTTVTAEVPSNDEKGEARHVGTPEFVEEDVPFILENRRTTSDEEETMAPLKDKEMSGQSLEVTGKSEKNSSCDSENEQTGSSLDATLETRVNQQYTPVAFPAATSVTCVVASAADTAMTKGMDDQGVHVHELAENEGKDEAVGISPEVGNDETLAAFEDEIPKTDDAVIEDIKVSALPPLGESETSGLIDATTADSPIENAEAAPANYSIEESAASCEAEEEPQPPESKETKEPAEMQVADEDASSVKVLENPDDSTVLHHSNQLEDTAEAESADDKSAPVEAKGKELEGAVGEEKKEIAYQEEASIPDRPLSHGEDEAPAAEVSEDNEQATAPDEPEEVEEKADKADAHGEETEEDADTAVDHLSTPPEKEEKEEAAENVEDLVGADAKIDSEAETNATIAHSDEHELKAEGEKSAHLEHDNVSVHSSNSHHEREEGESAGAQEEEEYEESKDEVNHESHPEDGEIAESEAATEGFGSSEEKVEEHEADKPAAADQHPEAAEEAETARSTHSASCAASEDAEQSKEPQEASTKRGASDSWARFLSDHYEESAAGSAAAATAEDENDVLTTSHCNSEEEKADVLCKPNADAFSAHEDATQGAATTPKEEGGSSPTQAKAVNHATTTEGSDAAEKCGADHREAFATVSSLAEAQENKEFEYDEADPAEYSVVNEAFDTESSHVSPLPDAEETLEAEGFHTDKTTNGAAVDAPVPEAERVQGGRVEADEKLADVQDEREESVHSAAERKEDTVASCEHFTKLFAIGESVMDYSSCVAAAAPDRSVDAVAVPPGAAEGAIEKLAGKLETSTKEGDVLEQYENVRAEVVVVVAPVVVTDTLHRIQHINVDGSVSHVTATFTPPPQILEVNIADESECSSLTTVPSFLTTSAPSHPDHELANTALPTETSDAGIEEKDEKTSGVAAARASSEMSEHEDLTTAQESRPSAHATAQQGGNYAPIIKTAAAPVHQTAAVDVRSDTSAAESTGALSKGEDAKENGSENKEEARTSELEIGEKDGEGNCDLTSARFFCAIPAPEDVEIHYASEESNRPAEVEIVVGASPHDTLAPPPEADDMREDVELFGLVMASKEAEVVAMLGSETEGEEKEETLHARATAEGSAVTEAKEEAHTETLRNSDTAAPDIKSNATEKAAAEVARTVFGKPHEDADHSIGAERKEESAVEAAHGIAESNETPSNTVNRSTAEPFPIVAASATVIPPDNANMTSVISKDHCHTPSPVVRTDHYSGMTEIRNGSVEQMTQLQDDLDAPPMFHRSSANMGAAAAAVSVAEDEAHTTATTTNNGACIPVWVTVKPPAMKSRGTEENDGEESRHLNATATLTHSNETEEGAMDAPINAFRDSMSITHTPTLTRRGEEGPEEDMSVAGTTTSTGEVADMLVHIACSYTSVPSENASATVAAAAATSQKAKSDTVEETPASTATTPAEAASNEKGNNAGDTADAVASPVASAEPIFPPTHPSENGEGVDFSLALNETTCSGSVEPITTSTAAQVDSPTDAVPLAEIPDTVVTTNGYAFPAVVSQGASGNPTPLATANVPVADSDAELTHSQLHLPLNPAQPPPPDVLESSVNLAATASTTSPETDVSLPPALPNQLSQSQSQLPPTPHNDNAMQKTMVLLGFPGSAWEYIMTHHYEAMHEAFITDAATAANVPHSAIQDVRYSKGSLMVDLYVLHSASIGEQEIRDLMCNYAYPNLWTLYEDKKRERKRRLHGEGGGILRCSRQPALTAQEEVKWTPRA